jgi:hypothetical protein
MTGGTHRIVFGAITLVFAYTTITNVIERPDGVKIASWFIVAIVGTSLISRAMRSTELRVQAVETDALARQFISEAAAAPVRIIANRPDAGDPAEYEHELREAQDSHHLSPDDRVLFVEVIPTDVSAFSGNLRVSGVNVGGYEVLRCASPAVPNALAALLLYVRDLTGKIPTPISGGRKATRLCTCSSFSRLGKATLRR